MPKTPLSEDQIAEIRRLYSLRGPKQYTPAALASMFRTSRAKIHRIVRDVPRGRRGSDILWDTDRVVDGPRIDPWEGL